MPGEGYQAGTAFVPVHPSLRGFQKSVAQQLKKELRDIEVPVQPVFKEPKGDPFEKYQKNAPKEGEKAGGKFSDSFQKQVRAALESLPEAEVDADTSPALREVANLRRELDALSNKRVGVDIDEGAALATLYGLQARLDAIGRSSPSAQVRVDVGTASAQLAAFQQQLDRIDGRRVAPDVDLGGAAVAGGGSFLSGLLPNLLGANAHLRIMHGLVVALAPAFTLAGASGVAAIGALLGPLAAAGAGFAGIAAVAAPAIGNVTEALQAQEAADKQAAATAHTSAGQRISSAYAELQARQAVADAERALARARADGDRQVEDAVRSLRRAREDANRAIQAANQRVRDSERDLADAQRDARAAQQDLTRARQDALRALEDMRERVTDLARDEESAEIALIEARQRLLELDGDSTSQALAREQALLNVTRAEEDLARVLADSSSSALDRMWAQHELRAAQEALAAVDRQAGDAALERRKAELELAEAEDRLSDVRRDKKRSTEELNAAEKAGVAGSEQVRAAQDRVSEANRRVADAKRANRQAQLDLARTEVDSARQVADAERRVSQARQDAARATADAQRALNRAIQAQNQRLRQSARAADTASAADRNLALAMAELSPWQRRLMRGWLSLKDAFEDWGRSLEPDVIPLFLRGMKLAERLLPMLTPIVQSAADGFDSLLDSGEKAMKSPFWKSFRDFLARMSGRSIEGFGKAAGDIATGFAGIMMAFEPLSKDILEGLGEWTESFAKWGKGLEDNPQFQEFIQYVRDNWPYLRDALAAFADMMIGFLKWMAASAPGTLAALRVGFTVLGKVFEVLAAVTTWWWEHVTRPIFRGLVALWRGVVAPAINWLWKKVFRPALNGIGSALKFVWRTILKPIWQSLVILWRRVVGPALNWLWRKVFRPALNGIGDLFRWVWRRLIKPPLDAMVYLWRRVVGPALNWLWKKVVRPALTGIGDLFRRMYNKYIKPVVDGMKRLITEVVPNAFKRGVAAIERAWTKVKQLVRRPIQAVVDVVYNNGIVKLFNRLSKAVGLKVELERFTLPKFERGGVLGGPASKHDNQIIAARSNESVMVPEWTQQVGGPRAVDAMNRAAEHGNLREMMSLQGFARGGVVGYKGHRFTAAMVARIKAAEKAAGYGFRIFQGGFRPYTSYSGGTHMKDAIDYGPVNRRSVAAARKAGIIAWDRTGKGNWAPHIHGIPVPGGGVRLSPSAYSQYLSFKRGGDGLGGRDNGPRGAIGTLLGFLLNAWKKAKSLGGWIKNASDRVAEFAAHPAEIVKKFIGGKVDGLLDKIPGSGMIGRIARNIPGTIVNGLVDFAKKKAPSLKTASIKGRSPAAAKNYAKNIIAPRFGWNNALQWAAWLKLGNRESGWRWNARNPSSGAYGIPQALPGHKMASAGADWRTNPATQILWMARYMRGRYNSPLGAWGHSQRTGWYDNGGVLPPGLTTVYNGTKRPEMVLNQSQFAAMETLAKRGAAVATRDGLTVNVHPHTFPYGPKQLAHDMKVVQMRDRIAQGRPA